MIDEKEYREEKDISFHFREKSTIMLCVGVILLMVWVIKDLLFKYVSIEDAKLYYAANIIVTLGAFFGAFSLINKSKLFNREGLCSIHIEGEVKIKKGKKEYHYPIISEVFGYTTGFFSFDTYPIIVIKGQNKKEVQIIGCPEKGKCDFEETSLYNLFLHIVGSNNRLKPVQDIFGDDIEYWYAIEDKNANK